MNFYNVADPIPWKNGKRIFDYHNIKAVLTGDYRRPEKGEWFLSGAIPQAYLCKTDMMLVEYNIVKLVRTKTKTCIVYVEDL